MTGKLVELSSILKTGISVSGFARVAHDWVCQKRGLACLDFWLLNFCRIWIYRRWSCNSALNLFGHQCCQVCGRVTSFLGECIYGSFESEIQSHLLSVASSRGGRACGEFERPNP